MLRTPRPPKQQATVWTRAVGAEKGLELTLGAWPLTWNWQEPLRGGQQDRGARERRGDKAVLCEAGSSMPVRHSLS